MLNIPSPTFLPSFFRFPIPSLLLTLLPYLIYSFSLSLSLSFVFSSYVVSCYIFSLNTFYNRIHSIPFLPPFIFFLCLVPSFLLTLLLQSNPFLFPPPFLFYFPFPCSSLFSPFASCSCLPRLPCLRPSGDDLPLYL